MKVCKCDKRVVKVVKVVLIVGDRSDRVSGRLSSC